MPDHVPIPNYPFGIEFEVIMPQGNSGDNGRANLAEAITAAGVQCFTESYNHTVRDHWKIVTDASLGYENAEVVSPILRGEDGLTQIRTVTKAIDEFGARVNRSCGMHVHVGVRGEPHDRVGTVKELIRTYNKFEPILDQLTAPSRRGASGGGGYCGVVPFNPSCHTATNLDELRRAYGTNRSRKLNLEAYWRHGTVEFRHHQGTVNGEKAVNWVKLCLRMMAHAAKNTEPSRVGTMRPDPRFTPPSVVRRDVNAAPRMAGADIPRFVMSERWRLREMVITYVVDRTPRRAGTAGRINHDNHNVAAAHRISLGERMSLWDYHRRGGQRTHLAWDVDHGYVRVVNRATAPVIQEPVATVAEADASIRAEPTFERPATDTTPTTLDGLMELIEADQSERTFFAERQMELNA